LIRVLALIVALALIAAPQKRLFPPDFWVRKTNGGATLVAPLFYCGGEVVVEI
jgi:hypothetical protein